MVERLLKGGRLLLVCGALEAVISLLYLMQRSGDGALTYFRWRGMLVLLGRLTLAAGVCTVGAGLRDARKSRAWLLVLNGLACGALGSMLAFEVPRSLSFRTVALLMVVMAISLGIYELAGGRRRLVSAAGIVSIVFGCAFVAFVFGWMKLTPGAPTESLHWLGAYFGFSAICMLMLSWGRAGRLPVLSPEHGV